MAKAGRRRTDSDDLGPLSRLRGTIGRYLSVRLKLTLWYGGICGLTLLLAGAGMYVAIQGQLSSQIDAALVKSAAEVNDQLLRTPHTATSIAAECRSYQWQRGMPVVYRPRLTAFRHYCSALKRVLNDQVTNIARPATFEVIFVDPPVIGLPPAILAPLSTGSSGLEAEMPLLLIGSIAGGAETGHFENREYQGQSLREYIVPLKVPQRFHRYNMRGALLVYQNRKAYNTVQNTILITLLFGIPLGLLVAIGAGWLIARAALRPIGRISRTVRAIGESRDLSRRVRFVGPEDELGQLADTFDDMMDRLEQVFEQQKRFIADASHELRTPLTAIRGNADLMRIAPPEEREACVAAIRKESERMTRLVNDLLLLAEAEVGDKPIRLRPVDLDDVLLDVYHSTQLIAAGKVALVLENADHVVVDGDSDRLKQLLLNLADNAVKFTPEGGTVTMAVYRESGEARIVVSDSGVGIAVEDQEAIFRRFYRVEQSRSTRGSGLGLAIVAWIAAAHGGTIDLSSVPGKGSTFTVRLPLADEATAPAPAAS